MSWRGRGPSSAPAPRPSCASSASRERAHLTDASIARRAWLGLEAVHAVVYFAPEARDAYAGLGLKGFWMGYFASRAAPLGPVPAPVVEAMFFGFSPNMVRRALPDAWSVAPPADVL